MKRTGKHLMVAVAAAVLTAASTMLAWGLCCGAAMALISCSNGEEPAATVTQSVPMVLEAAVGSEIETRASKDGTWASSNNVTVYVGSAKNYRTPSPSNTATATISGINLSNTHHWTSSTETKDVKAWFYGDNVYRTSCTGTWTIPTTQDANTVQNFDFLYASKKISYGDASKALDFYHQLARVTVTVKFLNNSLTTVTGVKLGNDNVWPSGTFNQPTISTTNSTYGTWTKSGTGVTIQMYGSGNSTTGTYTALIIPQEFAANEPLFTIETNDGNSVYTPTSKTTFAPGSHYTYELTVQNGLVSVQTETGIMAWQPANDYDANYDIATASVTVAGQTYTGAALTPAPTVRIGSKTLVAGTDYSVSYLNNTNAGLATVLISPKGKYFGENSATFTIAKCTPTLTFDGTTLTLSPGGTATRTASAKAGTKTIDAASYISYTSSSTSVATVSNSGVVTGVAEGSATITATVVASNNWTSTTKSYTVNVNRKTFSTSTSDDIGKVICSNGHVHATVSDVDCGGVGRAMICYISSPGHGLAIALEDASSSAEDWGDAFSTVSSWASGKSISGCTWRLPTADDWKYIFAGCGGSSYAQFSNDNSKNFNYSYGNIRDYLVNCGGTNFRFGSKSLYWTATEWEGDTQRDAWYYYFNTSLFVAISKVNNRYVRACLAF